MPEEAKLDQFLKLVLDNLQDEVYIFEIDDLKIQYMNYEALARCGWTLSVARSMSIKETASNFDEALFRQHTRPLFNGEKQVVVVETVHDKGPVEISTRIYQGVGTDPVFVSVLRDISERKMLEKAKLDTVFVVSHELRTPLTSIKGSLNLLRSGLAGSLPEQAASIIDIADRNSERLLLIVDDILDLEKMQVSRSKFEMHPVNLSCLLYDAANANKGYADEYQIRFETKGLDQNAIIEGNADRLMQVLSNLMSNAVKFSPEGSIVSIELSELSSHWRVSVHDNGPGIPKEKFSSMFETFSQIDTPGKRMPKGTGLGLAISKEIILRHSGVVNLDSTVGEGTTFYFDLPKPALDGSLVEFGTRTA